MKKTWIFQGSQKYFDIDSYVREWDELCWSVKQHVNEIKKGDEVFIFRARLGSKKPAAIIAHAEILTDPAVQEEPEIYHKYQREAQDDSGRRRVHLRIIERAETDQEELLRDELVKDSILNQLTLFKMANKTNFPVPEDAQIQRLNTLWKDRLNQTGKTQIKHQLSELKRDDFLKAIKHIDEFGIEPFGAAVYYNLLFEDKIYPPKAVFGIAAKSKLGRNLSPNEFPGGRDTLCFQVLEREGFEIVPKKEIESESGDQKTLSSNDDPNSEHNRDELLAVVFDFVKNTLDIDSGEASLKTKHYSQRKYKELDVRVSFGQGNFAAVTWVAFLGHKQRVQEGIYPVILFSHKGQNKFLEVCYGISETNQPIDLWPDILTKNLTFSKTNEYASCFCKKSYSIDTIADLNQHGDDIVSNIDLIIDDFNRLYSGNRTVPMEDKNNNSYSVKDIVNDGCFIKPDRLDEILSKLRDKKNIILQGPPGTGKTWLARKLGFAAIGRVALSHIRVIQFHPNFSYEDFIRGYRPSKEGRLVSVDGPFLEMVNLAKTNKEDIYILVIEEINRGNPAHIFGEMLTLIDSGNRKEECEMELCHPDRNGNRDKQYVPENLFIIGTMNVADRSIAMMDVALRRRFAFIDLEPEFGEVWENWVADHCGLERTVAAKIVRGVGALNKTISDDRRLGKQFRIGHSYFTPTNHINSAQTVQWFRQIVITEIGPLLDEYWFDSPDEAIRQRNRLLEIIS